MSAPLFPSSPLRPTMPKLGPNACPAMEVAGGAESLRCNFSMRDAAVAHTAVAARRAQNASASPPSGRAAPANVEICPLHPTEALSLCCTTCDNAPICSHCLVPGEAHHGHEPALIGARVEALRDEVCVTAAELEGRAEEVGREHEAMLAKLLEARQLGVTMVQDVDAAFAALEAAVRERRAAMRTEVMTRVQGMQAEIGSKANQLDEQRTRLRSCAEYVRAIVQATGGAEFLSQGRH